MKPEMLARPRSVAMAKHLQGQGCRSKARRRSTSWEELTQNETQTGMQITETANAGVDTSSIYWALLQFIKTSRLSDMYKQLGRSSRPMCKNTRSTDAELVESTQNMFKN